MLCWTYRQRARPDLMRHKGLMEGSSGLAIPPSLRYIGSRAFLGCTAFKRLAKMPGRHKWRGVYAEENAFAICPVMRWPPWLHMIPDMGYTPGLGWGQVFLFHEYGRRVGMVPRSSLKEGKKRQMVEKGTKTPKTNPKPNTQARRPTPPSCSLPYTLGETCETETSDN